MSAATPTLTLDVALVGGGIMSATLGTFLQQIEPGWSIGLFENLKRAGLESSDPWNNAGTGHSALCELNYSPAGPDGSVDPKKALGINEQFQLTRQFYSWAVSQSVVKEPQSFIHPLPHMSFVIGEDNRRYLKTRHDSLSANTLFDTMEYTEDLDQIREWAPLVSEGRTHKNVAASRVVGGTDVDFGALSSQLVDSLAAKGADVRFEHRVTNIARSGSGWRLTVKNKVSAQTFFVDAKFVFVGAGGGALPLLQKSGIDEIKGFGGFPVSGEFLRCTNEEVINRHEAKVYGQASVGAPPMSVPHLDTRYVDGKKALMFGPYGGFSPKFLKTGKLWDLPGSVRTSNLVPMLAVAKDNLDLVKYLVTELMKTRNQQMEAMREYYPAANLQDWELITAGQRVQVIKKDPKKGGVLQFGTEVIASADGSISGLLGASPGASTATPIMLGLLKRCFPNQFAGWEDKLKEMVPTLGHTLNQDSALYQQTKESTDRVLHLA
ncbi:malate:quinone oxidoreductase [Galactobacter caseinivorans]|uniref:malate:quinone oxidoreductase n=1 Tax=Galactobacter caseinivorans TaxID=2676123 RepID=UPI002277C47C|nr:malate:quinone oxidoreductase [Galactobacter caseinivorans]